MSGSGGSTPGDDGNRKCDGVFKFSVVIQGNETVIWDECEIDDKVEIELVQDEDLPALQVNNIDKDLFIGMVPPRFGKIMDCIMKDWGYKGNIIDIRGNKNDPDVFVKVEGVKK